MSRPVCYIIPAAVLSLGIVFTGCKTVYTDMYSPRRNHFVPVKEKPKPEPAPIIEDTTTVTSPLVPDAGLPPAAPPSAPVPAPEMPAGDAAAPADAAPMIPGL